MLLAAAQPPDSEKQKMHALSFLNDVPETPKEGISFSVLRQSGHLSKQDKAPCAEHETGAVPFFRVRPLPKTSLRSTSEYRAAEQSALRRAGS